MGTKNRMTGRGPGFDRPAGVPFSERGPDAFYRLTREGTPLLLEIRVNMRGTEYHRVTLVGTGTDGLPISYDYRDHYNGRLGVSMFKHIRGSEGTALERVYDSRPPQLQHDLAD